MRTHESQQPQPGNAFAKALLLLLIRLQLQLQLHRAVPDALTAAGDTFLCGCQKYHFIATKMTTLSRPSRCPPPLSFPIHPCDSVIQIFRLIRRQFAQSKSVIWALPRPAIMKCLTAKPLWKRERGGKGRCQLTGGLQHCRFSAFTCSSSKGFARGVTRDDDELFQ